jgi:hypothetical protein
VVDDSQALLLLGVAVNALTGIALETRRILRSRRRRDAAPE